jgi:hypothetical protein
VPGVPTIAAFSRQRGGGLTKRKCPTGCLPQGETRASLPLDAIRRARDTPIWKLEPSFRCRSCGTGRYKPPVRMIKLTEQREITPYKWVHPDEELLPRQVGACVGALHEARIARQIACPVTKRAGRHQQHRERNSHSVICRDPESCFTGAWQKGGYVRMSSIRG